MLSIANYYKIKNRQISFPLQNLSFADNKKFKSVQFWDACICALGQ